MERKLTNRVTMFKTVDGYLDQKNSVWNGMAPFAAAVQQLKQKLVAIDTAAQKQETPVSGAAGDKAAARDGLEDVLFLMCEALGVLAHTSNDHELKALVDISPTAIDRLNDEELGNRATNVLAKANAMKTELATMQVTQANIDELDAALQTYLTAKAKPRTAVVERMVQTETLPALVRETSNILRDQIDKLVNLFKRTNPEFVAGYKSARVVMDRVAGQAARPAETTQPSPPTS
jgi:hypothetical protein